LKKRVSKIMKHHIDISKRKKSFRSV